MPAAAISSTTASSAERWSALIHRKRSRGGERRLHHHRAERVTGPVARHVQERLGVPLLVGRHRHEQELVAAAEPRSAQHRLDAAGDHDEREPRPREQRKRASRSTGPPAASKSIGRARTSGSRSPPPSARQTSTRQSPCRRAQRRAAGLRAIPSVSATPCLNRKSTMPALAELSTTSSASVARYGARVNSSGDRTDACRARRSPGASRHAPRVARTQTPPAQSDVQRREHGERGIHRHRQQGATARQPAERARGGDEPVAALRFVRYRRAPITSDQKPERSNAPNPATCRYTVAATRVSLGGQASTRPGAQRR